MAMILGPFVSSLTRILSQMAQDEVGQLLGVPGEVVKLTRMVHQIQGVLVDAERRQNESEAINRWVKQLKDVMYDADDVIDLCRIKTDEGHAQSGSSSYSKISCGIHFLSCFRNPIFAREIAGKIKELNSRMNAIVVQIGFLGLIENRGASSEARQMASNISRETDPLIALSDLVGEKIEEDAEQLVKLLTPDVTEGHANIPIVAIEGMGGIGKTTLAKKVYNDPIIQQNFDHLIWVCVSKEIKQVDLVKNVIRVVGGDCGAAEKKSELAPMLQQLIQGKKFFLVLDDIWAESEKVWHDHLRVPMSSGAPGSRVLITTRDGEVAMRMRAIHTHKVNGLTDEDGWSLLIKQNHQFQQLVQINSYMKQQELGSKVSGLQLYPGNHLSCLRHQHKLVRRLKNTSFSQVAPHGVESEFQDLKDIGMQIVKKCDGLPLAIKSIGGVLCTKGNTKGDWLIVLRSNVWSMDGLPGDVHHVFYLSYEDLSPPLKQCFIFCSLFPEDFELWKKDLIFMWIAEGFLQDKDNFWELGNEYYTELIQRNLLEVTRSTVDQVQCKMHDLLWSFARHLGKDENCVLWEGQVLSRYEGSLKVRRLSIEGRKVDTKVIKNEKGLRTMLLRDKLEVALGDLCKVFSNLRILDLNWSSFSSLPDSFCDLVHLRYLDVSGSNITNLPNSIGNLKYLVYLNIAFCYDLSHVPCSIINLRELKLLNTYYSGVEAVPSGLYKLDKLVELYGFKPYQNCIEGFSSLEALEDLSQLVTLHLVCLENVSNINIAKRANLRSKSRLHNLYLEYTSLIWEDQLLLTDGKKITTLGILNELCPPPSLEFLQIVNYFGNHLPNWLNWAEDLPNLRFVEISDCACFEKLAPLGQLHNLDTLRINGAYSVVIVGNEFMQGDTRIVSSGLHATSGPAMLAFPKLSQLQFDGMSNWKEWQWNNREPAMPKLKQLSIRDCSQLSSLPEGLLHYATSLEYLKIGRADRLITIENLSSIKNICVYENPNLRRISNLPSTSYIEINNCPNLEAVENLQTLQKITLIDYKMETLPEYLMTTMPQKLIIHCSDNLLLEITDQEGGAEWHKCNHIPTVQIYSQKHTYQLHQYMHNRSIRLNLGR